MSLEPKDQRPKVIYFHQPLDGLNIFPPQSVLWPCHAFSISIPKKKKRDLNVFEETVLKLTEVESGDTRKLADITCMNRDKDEKDSAELVSFIQSRLHNLGLLDKRYELTEDGKKILKNWKNNSEENLEYVAGTVFLDLHSGKLLPYVHIGDLKKEKILSLNQDFVFVELGSTGKSKQEKCRMIPPSNSGYWKTIPDSNEIIRAIMEFKKKYRRYAFMNQGVEKYPPPIPRAEAISLYDNPELVYLHCYALIQIGNSDILVTDGCGFGFSESFASYLTSQNWQWLIDFKSKGIIERLSSYQNNEKTQSKRAQDVKPKYQQVTSHFLNQKYGIDSLLKDLMSLPKTEAEEKDYVAKRQQIASKCYESLEQALAYIVVDYPVPVWEDVFSSQNYKDNEKLLCKFAKKVGFSLSGQGFQMLQVKSGAIRQIDKGKVMLQPLLAIAIAGAATNYPRHPLHTLARNHSGFLGFAHGLKKLRDPINHGEISDFETDQIRLVEIAAQTKCIIKTILPDITEEFWVDREFLGQPSDDINQERLKAELKLERYFNLPFVQGMAPELKEQLVRIELMLAQFSYELIMEILKCMASSIQVTLHSAQKECNSYEIENDDLKSIALDRLCQASFFENKAMVPASISSVRNKMIQKALLGSGSTLGAELIVICATCRDNDLQELRKREPDIIASIAQLLEMRGHGNTTRYNFSRNEMESLKNNVYKIIKIITEVF